MVSEKLLDRRTFLQSTGVTASAALLAGCGGPDGDDGGGGEGEGPDDEAGGENADEEMEDNETGDTETEAGNETDGDGGDGGVDEEVDEYLSDVENYDGVTDETGSDEVTVQVGAEGNGGNFAFEPAAVQVSPGTDVVWEWTGEGGGHNVVHEDGEFGSELQEEEGATFTYTFEEAGNFLYYCEPHRGVGMKGAVIVQE
jgi:halocyanin-like protein